MVNWLVPVRAVQGVFALICLGLSGWLVSKLDDYYYDNSRADFNVFASVFTLLSLVYLLGILFVFKDSSFAHPIFSIVLDGLNWIFWLAAFACIAAVFHGFYSDGHTSALIAFGVLEWLLFSVTLTFAVISLFRGRSSKGTTGPTPGV